MRKMKGFFTNLHHYTYSGRHRAQFERLAAAISPRALCCDIRHRKCIYLRRNGANVIAGIATLLNLTRNELGSMLLARNDGAGKLRPYEH